ncbi:MAG: recombinase family protein [Clostridiales bacterium]|nr:recombinase family protein [Clostridiales bacterium]
MIYGYCRVSSKSQAKDGNSLNSQKKALLKKGAVKIFTDVFNETKNVRPELERLLSEVRPGDKIIVTKLDRMARSVQQGISLIEDLIEKDISVDVLNIGIFDNTPTGKLIRHVMIAFSEFERDMIMQRTREGKKIARQNPSYREGRPRKYTLAQRNHAMLLLERYSYKQVSEMTGISESTLAREAAYRRHRITS